MPSLHGFAGTIDGIYGNATDGDLFITGTLVLTRDSFFRNVTLSGTNPTIITNNFRFFVQATCSFLTNGVIDNSGFSGTFAIPGTSTRIGSLPPGMPGGSGTIVTGFSGIGPGATWGGGGGAGGSGSQPGGPGGTAIVPDAISGSVGTILPMLVGFTFGQGGPYPIFGGGGGGGGGGPGAIQRGGGGGSGGGVLCIAVREILVRTRATGTLRVNGGPGGPGEIGSVTGGGGGGGGGVVLLTTSRFYNQIGAGFSAGPALDPTFITSYISPWDGALLLQSDGGIGGSGVGGGALGSPGGSGSIFVLVI